MSVIDWKTTHAALAAALAAGNKPLPGDWRQWILNHSGGVPLTEAQITAAIPRTMSAHEKVAAQAALTALAAAGATYDTFTRVHSVTTQFVGATHGQVQDALDRNLQRARELPTCWDAANDAIVQAVALLPGFTAPAGWGDQLPWAALPWSGDSSDFNKVTNRLAALAAYAPDHAFILSHVQPALSLLVQFREGVRVPSLGATTTEIDRQFVDNTPAGLAAAEALANAMTAANAIIAMDPA